MLSRKVVTRSGRGFRGYFPSKKLSRSVQFESILERDAIQIFEEADEVIHYQEQPTIIYYHDENGLPKKYYPDFELLLAIGQTVHVEIKPLAKLLSLELTKKYQAIQRHYASRSEHFLVLTDVDMRSVTPSNIYDLFYQARVRLNAGGQNETISL